MIYSKKVNDVKAERMDIVVHVNVNIGGGGGNKLCVSE